MIELNVEDLKSWIDGKYVSPPNFKNSLKVVIAAFEKKQEEIEQLKEDCAYWKMKYRDVITLDENEE